jgi:hypothetical protein
VIDKRDAGMPTRICVAVTEHIAEPQPRIDVGVSGVYKARGDREPNLGLLGENVQAVGSL